MMSRMVDLGFTLISGINCPKTLVPILLVECYFANTPFKCCNGVVPEYISEILKASLCRYSAKPLMILGMYL